MAHHIKNLHTLKMRNMIILAVALLLVLPEALAKAKSAPAKQQIPADEMQLENWFKKNVRAYNDKRPDLDPDVVNAEEEARIVKVRKDGTGDFKTVFDALRNIPMDNSERVIVWIGGGEYDEKVKIEKTMPYVTLYGDPDDMPTVAFGAIAKTYGMLDSATLIVEGEYFVAVNIIFMNSSPRPTMEMKGAQALAARVSSDRAAFYNCKFLGYQVTLCDDRGKHFFKDCFIQGTVDYIFGSGKSIYLNTELKTINDEGRNTFITAQAREKEDGTGFVFAHCKLTGEGGKTYLGRAWMAKPRVVFAYSTMTNAINPEGWALNNRPSRSKTVYFAEHKNKGPGANTSKRGKYVKSLTEGETKKLLNLDFIEASKWLLPPHNPQASLKKPTSDQVSAE